MRIIVDLLPVPGSGNSLPSFTGYIVIKDDTHPLPL